jgi:hypothetical protein
MQAYSDAWPPSSAESIVLACIPVGSKHINSFLSHSVHSSQARTYKSVLYRKHLPDAFVHASFKHFAKERTTTKMRKHSVQFSSTVEHNVMQSGHGHGRHGNQRPPAGAQVLSMVFAAKRWLHSFTTSAHVMRFAGSRFNRANTTPFILPSFFSNFSKFLPSQGRSFSPRSALTTCTGPLWWSYKAVSQ